MVNKIEIDKDCSDMNEVLESKKLGDFIKIVCAEVKDSVLFYLNPNIINKILEKLTTQKEELTQAELGIIEKLLSIPIFEAKFKKYLRKFRGNNNLLRKHNFGVNMMVLIDESNQVDSSFMENLLSDKGYLSFKNKILGIIGNHSFDFKSQQDFNYLGIGDHLINRYDCEILYEGNPIIIYHGSNGVAFYNKEKGFISTTGDLEIGFIKEIKVNKDKNGDFILVTILGQNGIAVLDNEFCLIDRKNNFT